MNTETIDWKPVADQPDSDITVLLFNKDADEPVWPGYLAGDNCWRCVDGFVAYPTHWADMPGGPKE